MNMRRRHLAVLAAAFLVCVTATAQDSHSLGEVVRQQQLQKEQKAGAMGNDASAPKVITNEEIPEHPEDNPEPASKNGKGMLVRSPAFTRAKQTAQYWKSRIQEQEGQIAILQRRMDEVNGSIRFSSVNCGANCVVRNERQRSKQRQVERMQGQLEEQKRSLEQMQDAARKQGYGSSVYDP
jgi:carbohydrate-selective porin OprB